MVKVHHLNCTLPEIVGIDLKKFNRQMCCHCLLLETSKELVLIDTGSSEEFISGSFRKHIVKKNESSFRSASSEIVKKGFDPKDVRSIFVSHLDHDHIGGVSDFPWADVHIHARELEFQKTAKASSAFRFQPQLWKSANFKLLDKPGENWFGLESVKAPLTYTNEILAIPLFGHTHGHCGFAIKTDTDQWLLHAGDSFFFKEDLEMQITKRSLFSEALTSYLAIDQKLRIENLKKLRLLQQDQKNCKIINSHDPIYLESLK